MAYDVTDLRSQLATQTRAPGANVAPQYFEYGDRMSSWVRSQTCILNYEQARANATLSRESQVDEYVVLVPDATTHVTLSTPTETMTAQGPALIVMPPGESMVAADPGGIVIRLFTTQNTGLLDRCENNGFFAEPDPNVAPFAAWPDPPDGHRIRIYPLDDVPLDPNRFGRIFRCSTFMVNWFLPDPGPRNPAKLSPNNCRCSCAATTCITSVRRGRSTRPPGATTNIKRSPARRSRSFPRHRSTRHKASAITPTNSSTSSAHPATTSPPAPAGSSTPTNTLLDASLAALRSPKALSRFAALGLASLRQSVKPRY
jgi:hypothetical protein